VCCTYNLTRRRVRVCVFVALGTQHAVSMPHTVICGFSDSTIYFFFLHFLINDAIFGKWVTEKKISIFIFSASFAWNISHVKKKWAKCNHKRMLAFMWNIYDSCQIRIFQTQFRKILKFLWKPVQSELSYSVQAGWRDMTTLIVAFRSFA